MSLVDNKDNYGTLSSPAKEADSLLSVGLQRKIEINIDQDEEECATSNSSNSFLLKRIGLGVVISAALLFVALSSSSSRKPTTVVSDASLPILGAAPIALCADLKEAGSSKPLSGAKVTCYDEDVGDDDVMAVGTTDSNGCATLHYDTEDWDWAWGDHANPDIYCVIKKFGAFELYTTTLEDHDQDTVAYFGRVTTYPDRIERGDGGSHNGCGAESFDAFNGIIDFLSGFAGQCNNHDLCYTSCKETQQTCDEEFKDLMYSQCNNDEDLGELDKVNCYKAADGMFNVVDEYGKAAFDASRGHCR